MRERVRVRVTGTVQGVGFRPFVYRQALELELAGHVLNDERGVVIEAEGGRDRLDELLRRLREEAPPLAEVESILPEGIAAANERGFRIVESERSADPDALVSPDMATCSACLSELFDPDDRRHRYPFINCTDCGPRFTIVRGVPYDRPLTTMAGFEMCPACRAEYEDPLDRRFHAQPNACPACGPAVRLLDPDGAELGAGSALDAVGRAAGMLAGGSIVAVKGLGGYHLACAATDEAAVAELRARKHREDKPFALMAPELEAARALVELGAVEDTLLTGRERPIVIARRRAGAEVAAGVAPGSRELGVMLPYAPLHHLLLADGAATLVMTSANVSDEPIAYLDQEARERLGRIADAFLVGDRPIHMRTDDSVLRALAEPHPPLVLRRSRGFVPRSVALPLATESQVLGCGAELKSTFCLARGGRAWVGHHIGDLKNWETLRSFREGIEHFQRLFSVEPELVAHDLHPDYLSTRYALEREAAETIAVQHHHAHLAACLAEHGETGRAVGAIFDGSGYGGDGTVWGGELLAGDLGGFERAGMLMPVRLPGGDAAVQEPWRMAASWLAGAFDTELPAMPPRLRDEVEAREWEAICDVVQSGIASPVTTSAGRLFDAVAAICGLRARINYEGQAAAELEAGADPAEAGAYPVTIDGGEGAALVLDPREAIRRVSAELDRAIPVARVAARFHNGLAEATALACARACERRGLDLVVLSGGVFQNRLLLERTRERLESLGLRVLVPVALPPNDGGIAYGQVAVACAGRPA